MKVIEGIKDMQSFEKAKQDIIEAFVTFYGEQYREYIEDRLNKVIVVNLSEKNPYAELKILEIKNGNQLISEVEKDRIEITGAIAGHRVVLSQNNKLQGVIIIFDENKCDSEIMIHELNHNLGTNLIDVDNKTFTYTRGIQKGLHDLNTGHFQIISNESIHGIALDEAINQWCTLYIHSNYKSRKNDNRELEIKYYTKLLAFVHEIFNCLKTEIKNIYMKGDYNAIFNRLGNKEYNTLQECIENLLLKCQRIDYKKANENNRKYNQDMFVSIDDLYKNLEQIYSCSIPREKILESIGSRRPNKKVRSCGYVTYSIVEVLTDLQPIYQKVKKQKLDKIITVNSILKDGIDKSNEDKEIVE